ncbi:hypothetical protein DFH06DRAFT_1392724 [Mycena polygramma]|nr:hypothetical protein DFH06DRAFT_1392724 [Mycena polygramma]
MRVAVALSLCLSVLSAPVLNAGIGQHDRRLPLGKKLAAVSSTKPLTTTLEANLQTTALPAPKTTAPKEATHTTVKSTPQTTPKSTPQATATKPAPTTSKSTVLVTTSKSKLSTKSAAVVSPSAVVRFPPHLLQLHPLVLSSAIASIVSSRAAPSSTASRVSSGSKPLSSSVSGSGSASGASKTIAASGSAAGSSGSALVSSVSASASASASCGPVPTNTIAAIPSALPNQYIVALKPKTNLANHLSKVQPVLTNDAQCNDPGAPKGSIDTPDEMQDDTGGSMYSGIFSDRDVAFIQSTPEFQSIMRDSSVPANATRSTDDDGGQ